MALSTDDGETTSSLYLWSKLDIGTTTSHIGGDSHSSETIDRASCLSYDEGLTSVLLSIEDIVRDISHLEHSADKLRNLNRCGTYEHWTSSITHCFNLLYDSSIFLAVGLIYAVVHIITEHRTVGRNLYHVELVDIPELSSLSTCSTGHTSELVIHTEVVLQGNGSIGLSSILHLYMLLSLDSLVETIAPTASFHDTSSLLIDNLHLSVHYDVLVITIEHRVCLEQLLDGMYAL